MVFIKYHRELISADKVVEVVLKLPGEQIESLPEYLKEDILFAFTYPENVKWLNENSLEHIMVYTTYSFSKWGLKLTIFFLINNLDVRALPFFYIITKQEREEVISYCLKKFMEKINICDKIKEVKFVMTDMVHVFFNAIENVFQFDIQGQYCEWNLKAAFKKKMQSLIPTHHKEIVNNFINLKNVSDETSFI